MNINTKKTDLFFNSLLHLNVLSLFSIEFLFEVSFKLFLMPYPMCNICFSYFSCLFFFIFPTNSLQNTHTPTEHVFSPFICCLPLIQKRNLKPSTCCSLLWREGGPAWLTFPDQYRVSVEVFFQEDLGQEKGPHGWVFIVSLWGGN